MKIDVNEQVLLDLLSITQQTIDGGELYMFFSDDYTKQQLDAVSELSATLRLAIHTDRIPSGPSTQQAQTQTLETDS